MDGGKEGGREGTEGAGTYHQSFVVLNLCFRPLGLLAVRDVVSNGATEEVGALADEGNLLVKEGGREGLREGKMGRRV